MPPFPLTVWVAARARNSNVNTVKNLAWSLLSSHRHHSNGDTSGVGAVFTERILLGAIDLCGARRLKQALPITLPILRSILEDIEKGLAHHSVAGLRRTTVCTAFCLAFGCWLRVGKIIYSDGDFD